MKATQEQIQLKVKLDETERKLTVALEAAYELGTKERKR